MNFSSKDELSFLNYFDIAKSSASGNAKEKLQITSQDDKTYFSLFSNELIVISSIDKYERDFDVVIDIDDFYSVIKNISQNQSISLDKNVLSFNETKYVFEEHIVTLPSYSDYLDVINNNDPDFVVKDLMLENNFSIALDFIGERDTSSIEYVNDHFVATNKVKACMIKNKKTSIKNELVFSKVLCNFLNKAKLKSIDISCYTSESSSYYVIKIDHTYIISSIPEYKLPNLFDSKFMKMYNHTSKLEIDKNALLEALKRIKIVTKFDIVSRAINFYAYEGKIVLKADDTKTSASALETIPAQVDSELHNFFTRFNSNYLQVILQYIESNVVKIYVSSLSDFLVAKITDEKEENIFLLTRLHTN